ncbi:MAG: bifunctional 4-hydroxy-2-oxoglutarate aldolase/2-dehydro-3-deoxy-phosphogluconate aldolase [Pseudomonadales bacterium]|nr:bifunctional 4-hydroxy-2-oxoglutarate aldolase/2-dehydro-3-deoxy-phosphogluconate aldolase [Pseudomonadales bacterium]
MNPSELFTSTPIVPVVVIDDSSLAVPLADCLAAVGMTSIEITLRTEGALKAINSIATSCPEVCVGAGSIRRVSQIQEALDAGARFCVSPGYTDAIIGEATVKSVSLIPGASTATEVMYLFEQGFELIKFFPAELAGGLKMIKALSSPIPELQFFPTGGITAELAKQYLAESCIPCVGGTWFVPADRVNAADFGWIAAEAKAALDMLR